MKNLSCLVAALSIVFSVAAAAQAPKKAKRFVCAPCGKVSDKPGNCPTCGMPLVDQDATVVRKKVAILIFNGVEIIDYTGPYEVFGGSGFDVYTVAETKEPVTTAMGMTVVPKYTFADAPQANVVVVPGGGVRAARASASTLKWVRDQTAHAEHTMSVCNGAFILASAGLLDGLSATTTAHLIDQLRSEFPKTKVVSDQRFVDNGKIITTAGLSSGIDGALHVVSRLIGQGNAEAVALGIEYDWRPRSGFARAALADMLIPQIDLDAIGHWDFVSTEGGIDRWEMVIRGTSDRTAAQVMEHLERELSTNGKWIRMNGSPATSHWKLTGRGRATVTLLAPSGQSREYTIKLSLTRGD